MKSEKPPTHIELAPGDAAFIIRENGELEIVIPDKYSNDGPMPPSHVMLAGFAVGFEDERLRDVLTKIIEERRDLIEAAAPPEA